MNLEQATIKTGSTEIPLVAFNSVGFWCFLFLDFALFVYWLSMRVK